MSGYDARAFTLGDDRPALESVGLWGECGEFSVPARFWLGILGLARHYGWEPRGTLPPQPDFANDELPESFDGCYYPAYAQRIQVDDVVALANALEHTLPDIPDIDTGGCNKACVSAFIAHCRELPDLPDTEGRSKAWLRAFIAHCREGGEIWIC